MWHLKRDGAWLALAFILGRLLFAGVYWPLLLLPAAAYFCRPGKLACVLALALGLCGLGWGSGAVPTLPAALDTDRPVSISGTVLSTSPYRTTLLVDREKGRPAAAPYRVSLRRSYGDDRPLARGQQVAVKAYLRTPEKQRAPGGFNEALWLTGQGVFVVAQAREKVTAGPPVPSRLQDLATVLQKRLTAYLSPDSASLTRAILLGETAGLHPDFYHRGQLLGMVHIFAVSGLHVGMILAFIMALLRLVQVQSLGARLIAAGPLLMGYALLVGAPPSAVRAVVMAVIALLALGSHRYADPPSILIYAAAALVIMDPYCLWQIGFQLSFIITGGLILLVPPLQRLLAPLPPVLANPLAVALAAEMAGAPLIAYYFNLWTPLSVVANLVLVPLVGLLVPLVLAALLASFVLSPVAGLLFSLADSLARLIIWLVQVAGGAIAAHHVNVGAPSFWAVLLAYGAMGVGVFALKQVKQVRLPQRLAALALAAGVIGLLYAPVDEDLSCLVLDVGQGSAAYWQSPEGVRLLFDTGPSADGAAAAMRALGVNRLDAVVVSHGDEDHLNGLARVLDDVQVDRLLVSAPLAKDEALQALAPRLLATQVLAVADRKSLQIGDVTLKLSLLSEGDDEEANANQLAAYLTDGRSSLAAPGDSPAEAMTAWHRPPADVLLVPHHGSRNSLAPQDLQRHPAALACCSAGRHNRYGHPHPQVRAAYARAQIPFYVTADQASLFIYRAGQGLEVATPYA